MTDDELLALLQEVEARKALVGHATEHEEDEEAEAPPRERPGDPCFFCGEPALDLGTCFVCETPGCLPRDDWMPGDADPCMTRCARCGSLVHAACCSAADGAGNPVCCGHRFSDAGWSGY